MRLMRAVLAAILLGSCAPLLVAAPADATTRSVMISGYQFSPASLTVTVGDTVIWTNHDEAPHDVTTTHAPLAIHGATMTKGQSWSYTFTEPGTYAYICSIHPDMTASITVVVATTHARAPSPDPTTVVRREVSRLSTRAAPHAAAARVQTPSRPTPPIPSASTVVATSTQSQARLRPLLIVAGIVAAVTTLALLMLASVRPEDPH